ncbi:piggyBac transposable element-derived protein 3-like [Octopus bimaculoides]|uniref:piggyBac transposable element-derived protein 3-like n=1 Tax=Octopus bimaculoides TaxID=37653 RepID=UPI00071D6D93|nr:piggyBac transposable element-derived protein 3-like [Octopus bimaculoides]|eukprot:XP_014789159.1 PREDICTED: piggyBac transposable element-derived protein 3-like [Octopus bimaculoides]
MFMRSKPIKFGYKFWCLCSYNGYLFNFDPYYGKGDSDSKEPLGMRVVKKLTDVLPSGEQSYQLFFDNFFTSIETLALLREKHLKATGTIRENCCKKCPMIDYKTMQKKERGHIDYRVDCTNKILITRWNDNKPVSVATNYSSVYPTVTARQYSQKEKQHLNVNMPKCISEYNHNMSGVDMLDKQVSLYRTRIRGKKWWFPMFTQFFYITVVYAWCLYQEASTDKTMSLLTARRKIILSYLSKPTASDCKRSGRKTKISKGRKKVKYLGHRREDSICTDPEKVANMKG